MHIVTYKTFIHVRWMLYRSCVVTYKCIKHNLQAHVYTTRNLLQHVFTATLLVWRWRHSNRVRCACGQAGPGGDLRHPEELPVLSARAGIQHGRGRDHEWTCLLHTGWALFTCMTSVNSSSVLQFTTNINLTNKGGNPLALFTDTCHTKTFDECNNSNTCIYAFMKFKLMLINHYMTFE